MNTSRASSVDRLVASLATLVLVSAFFPAVAHAEKKKQNPASKVYVSDVLGEAQIDIGDSIQDLTKKSVYNAQGTIIETKKAEKPEDKDKVYSTAVYSNGTGAFYGEDTKVEMKKFLQEPFTPNRVDNDVEPSISQTQAFVARGSVGLCTSKQVAGSNMTYSTSQGSVSIRGKKIVIDAGDNETKISMLEGDSTVRAGALDMGGQVLHTGEQAIIRPGSGGAAGTIQIQKIPASELAKLDDKVAAACMAKKTVYFEVKDKSSLSFDSNGKATDATEGADGVTAFNGDSANNTSSVSTGQIIAVPTIPSQSQDEPTVSPATIKST